MQDSQKKQIINTQKAQNRWVISDIHGCLRSFKALIKKIHLTQNDYLFLLGDYIDKGPDSAGVLDYILELQNQNFQVFPLRGNHEQNLLETSKEYNKETFKFFVEKMNKSKGLLNEDVKIFPRFENFLQKLPYCYELEDFYLVHAGFDFRKPNPLENYDAMLHIRFFEADKTQLNGKRIIHGHQPTYIEDIEKSICMTAPAIPLDNACVYQKRHKYYEVNQLGRLCALNIDTMTLVKQMNIEE